MSRVQRVSSSCPRLVPLVVTVVTHLRFHRLHPLANLSPPFLPHARPPLNVRQVIYTRGFTARKILRKAVTRDRNATRGTASSLFFFFRERKIIFLRGNVHGPIFLLGTFSREREREIVHALEERNCKNCESRRWRGGRSVDRCLNVFIIPFLINLATCCYLIDETDFTR